MVDNAIHDIAQVQQMRDDLEVPFSIELEDGVLQCNRLLRILPGKRIVVAGRLAGEAIVAKLFFANKGAKRHMRREMHGTRLLEQAKILTPAILYHGKTEIAGLYAVVFAGLQPTVDTSAVWKGDDANSVKQLLHAMQEIVVRQHQFGIRHHDLHPNNFILVKDYLYTLDAYSVKGKVGQSGVSRAQSIDNLAKVYSQLYLKYDHLILDAFDKYCGQRGWQRHPELERQLLGAVKKWRCYRMKNAVNRALRNCSDNVVKKSFHCFMACKRESYTPAMQAFLGKPEPFIRGQHWEMLKDGNSSTVIKIFLDNRELVVKRYNIKNWQHYLRRCWRKSRAVKSWCNAHVLSSLGIMTPKPIACLEMRKGPLRGTAYYVSEYESGMLLSDFFAESLGDNDERFELAKNMISLLEALAMVQISHGDMKATNFILRNMQPVTVDLDSLRVHRSMRSFARAFKKDLARFVKNWHDQHAVKKLFVCLFDKPVFR